ncbi:hypothetical protein AB0C89_20875 [Streptomyces sp. NPDC048491]|uniref:hypothetical protein n=1 Tax=Streptomyces sp. NPDC048491 TaxID=3157207 RepID=UPI00342AAD1E
MAAPSLAAPEAGAGAGADAAGRTPSPPDPLAPLGVPVAISVAAASTATATVARIPRAPAGRAALAPWRRAGPGPADPFDLPDLFITRTNMSERYLSPLISPARHPEYLP